MSLRALRNAFSKAGAVPGLTLRTAISKIIGSGPQRSLNSRPNGLQFFKIFHCAGMPTKRHPAPTREDMKVDMRDALTGRRTVELRQGDALGVHRFAHPARNNFCCYQKFGCAFLRKFKDRFRALLWGDQSMPVRLGHHIHKRDIVRIFVNRDRGDFPAQYFCKYIVCVISHRFHVPVELVLAWKLSCLNWLVEGGAKEAYLAGSCFPSIVFR
jgi:hypothetical protein